MNVDYWNKPGPDEDKLTAQEKDMLFSAACVIGSMLAAGVCVILGLLFTNM